MDWIVKKYYHKAVCAGYPTKIEPCIITPRGRNMGMPQLRSFVTCHCAIDKMVPLLSFRLLRVLAIEHCEFKEGYQLEHLRNLLHLRYLGLIETNIRVLPKEIGHLRFLQTLLLNGTGIEELPSSLRLLPQLMCLRADWKTRAPNWIGMLTSLEDLRIYRGADDRSARRFVKELGNLTGLRVLRVGIAVLDENMERDLVKSLCNLKEIQHLHLEITVPGIDDTVDASPWMSKVNWEAEGFVAPPKLRCLLLGCIVFSRLPPWIVNPSCLLKLSHLCVHVDTMEKQDLKVIGMMPELNDLLLLTSSTVTISNIAEGSYFKKLRSCSMLSSMVQFVRNEDSGVSFHIWNGEDAMPFGTKKDGQGSIAPTIMPGLESLEFFFFVQTMEDYKGYCSSMGLEYLTALKKVTVRIGCQGASVVEVEEAEAALRQAAEIHPSHPTLELIRHFEDKMILDQRGGEAIQC